MARCRSWRPSPSAHSPSHPPGECFDCWKPCFTKVPKGSSICENCVDTLSRHPNASVRLAIVEVGTSEQTLLGLSQDLDAMVSYAAQWALEHRFSSGRRPAAPAPARWQPPPAADPAVQHAPTSAVQVVGPNPQPAPDPWAGWTDGR